VDVALREYYRRLREEEFFPRTSAPSPGEFLNLYQRLAASHQAAIVVTPPKELTQTYEAAILASEMIADRLTIHVVDSRVAGPAEGFVAVAAARLVATGASPQAILQALERIQKDVGFVGVLDTLKFLVEGGRVSAARQWVKSALRLYPVLCITHGQIRVVGMARTKSRALERMVHWLESTLPKDGVALAFCHTDAPQEAAALAERVTAIFHPTESLMAELTPAIGAHTGPGLVGVAWWVQSHPV
jgi:DegV family protein with EDD domain